MSSERYCLSFHGIRGSIASPGPATLRYGGETTCASVDLGAQRWIVLDCGTGIRRFGAGLPPADGRSRREFHILLSHYHWDHIQGLPFFAPLYDPGAMLHLYGWPYEGRGVRRILEEAIRPPFFPVPLDQTGSEKSFTDLDGNAQRIGELTVRTARLRHPQEVTAFRLEHPSGALVFATDAQSGAPGPDDALLDLCAGAQTLVLDAQYESEEQATRAEYGHGTWEAACAFASRAGVQRLVLFHHDPSRTDDELDRIVERARDRFPGVIAAREGSELRF